jgi:hypothetical protein
MVLGVTEAFRKLCGVGFSGATLPFGGGSFRLFLCWFSVCRGLGDFFSGNGVWLRLIFYSERHSFLGRSSPGEAWRASEVLVSQKCSAISLA